MCWKAKLLLAVLLLVLVIGVARWVTGQVEVAAEQAGSGVGNGVGTAMGLVALVVRLTVWIGLPAVVLAGGVWAWWRFSFPRRATKVLAKVVGVDEGGDDRPRLRRLWRRGSVWSLAWSMPIGGTVQRVRSNQASLEEGLDCGARVWFDRGLLRGEFGVTRLPDEVSYAKFCRDRPAQVARMLLPIPLGVTRHGSRWVDLTALPHVLVGGTTNFGKSGFLRELLTSLVTRFDPSRVRVVLVDMKNGVEFSLFAALPHLWHPVATDLAECTEGLAHVSEEIDERYVKLRSLGVENVARYNEARPEGVLPYLVVVVDEVGELRPADAADKEEREARQRVVALLTRIGRVGRAAGVHLVCATQRPDADTVGGQLKAQLPATVAFYTRDDTNSRILLDNSAASDLPAKPGRAIWQWGAEQIQMQVPNLEARAAEALLAGVKEGWWVSSSSASVSSTGEAGSDAA